MDKIMKIAMWISTFLSAFILIILVWPEKKHKLYEADPDYVQQALAYTVPPMPEGWQDKVLVTDRGATQIYYGQTNNASAAKARIVMVPGYTSAVHMYGEHIDMLQKRGFQVIGMDIRGQGRSSRARASQPEKLYVSDFSVYADDLKMVMDTLPDDGKPVIIMGTSFGAAVATRAAGEFSALGADGLLLLAPAYRPLTDPLSTEQAKTVMGFAKALGKSKRYLPGQGPWRPDGTDMTQPSDCSSYPPRLYLRDALYVRQPELRVGGATVQWMSEMIENGEIVTSPRFTERLTLPITVIAADNDVIVDGPFLERVCTEDFPNCKLVKLPQTGHCLTLENDDVLDQIWDEADALTSKLMAK